jgi:hypothetical protein
LSPNGRITFDESRIPIGCDTLGSVFDDRGGFAGRGGASLGFLARGVGSGLLIVVHGLSRWRTRGFGRRLVEREIACERVRAGPAVPHLDLAGLGPGTGCCMQ